MFFLGTNSNNSNYNIFFIFLFFEKPGPLSLRKDTGISVLEKEVSEGQGYETLVHDIDLI